MSVSLSETRPVGHALGVPDPEVPEMAKRRQEPLRIASTSSIGRTRWRNQQRVRPKPRGGRLYSPVMRPGRDGWARSLTLTIGRNK